LGGTNSNSKENANAKSQISPKLSLPSPPNTSPGSVPGSVPGTSNCSPRNQKQISTNSAFTNTATSAANFPIKIDTYQALKNIAKDEQKQFSPDVSRKKGDEILAKKDDLDLMEQFLKNARSDKSLQNLVMQAQEKLEKEKGKEETGTENPEDPTFKEKSKTLPKNRVELEKVLAANNLLDANRSSSIENAAQIFADIENHVQLLANLNVTTESLNKDGNA